MDTDERMRAAEKTRPYAANRALAVTSRLIAFAARRGFRMPQSSPARGIERFHEVRRERYLAREDLLRLGAALSSREITARHSSYAIAAIGPLLLTNMRLNEVLKLRWTKVDLEPGLLMLADSKAGRKPVILWQPAIELPRELPRVETIRGDTDEPRPNWVFPKVSSVEP